MYHLVYPLLSLWLKVEKRFGLEPYSGSDYSAETAARIGRSMEQQEARLRSMLQKFPLWVLGHKELCRLALARADVKTAYASAHAVRLLSSDRLEGELLLGCTFVRAGEFARARQVLEAVLEQQPDNIEAKEELIAALLPLGKKQRAEEVFVSIPEEKRSIQMQAVTKFLTS